MPETHSIIQMFALRVPDICTMETRGKMIRGSASPRERPLGSGDIWGSGIWLCCLSIAQCPARTWRPVDCSIQDFKVEA